MPFKLTPNDWNLAYKTLENQPSGTKFDKWDIDLSTGKKLKDKPGRNHSFIIIDGVIYALSNRTTFMPAEGTGCLVKQGLTKEGKLCAIKVKKVKSDDTLLINQIAFDQLTDVTSDAYKASKATGLFIGQTLRTRPSRNISPQNQANLITKHYSVMPWRGECLFDEIADKKLTRMQRLITGLRLCQLIEKLHKEMGIVHADIKPENISGKFNGNDIELFALDFDFAQLLNGRDHIIGPRHAGTPGFVSPEIFSKMRYSFASDNYALGIMLLMLLDVSDNNTLSYWERYREKCVKELGKLKSIPPLLWLRQNTPINLDFEIFSIFSDLLNSDYKKRSDALPIMRYLCKKILKDATLEQPIREEILAIQASIALLPKVAVPSVEVTTKPVTPKGSPERPKPLTPRSISSVKDIGNVTLEETALPVLFLQGTRSKENVVSPPCSPSRKAMKFP